MVNWLGNRYWTFRHRGRTSFHREYLLFFVLNGVGMLIAVACLWFSHYALGLTSAVADNISATTVALNDAITCLDNLQPPTGLHSLTELANGSFAGLINNEVCFSKPYEPHSWPLGNRYSFAGVGIALASAGNSAIILTDGVPYVATASVPDAASVGRIEKPSPLAKSAAPCLAKRGVVDNGGGCIFPSHDGLYVATANGVECITNALYRKDEWQALGPASFIAAFNDGIRF